MLNKELLKQANIDYEGAIRRFAGKEDLYEKYLMRFKEDTHYENAKTALENKDYKAVLEETHAMKGVVGTLGMNDLFEDCSAVVNAVRSDKYDELEVLLSHVEKSYNRVLEIYK